MDTASASSGAAGRWLFLRHLIRSLVFQMYQRSCQPLESSDGHVLGQPQRETWDAPTLGSCWDPVLHPAPFLSFLRDLSGHSLTTSPPGHGLNQGMQRLTELEGELAAGHVLVGAAEC